MQQRTFKWREAGNYNGTCIILHFWNMNEYIFLYDTGKRNIFIESFQTNSCTRPEAECMHFSENSKKKYFVPVESKILFPVCLSVLLVHNPYLWDNGERNAQFQLNGLVGWRCSMQQTAGQIVLHNCTNVTIHYRWRSCLWPTCSPVSLRWYCFVIFITLAE